MERVLMTLWMTTEENSNELPTEKEIINWEIKSQIPFMIQKVTLQELAKELVPHYFEDEHNVLVKWFSVHNVYKNKLIIFGGGKVYKPFLPDSSARTCWVGSAELTLKQFRKLKRLLKNK